MNIVIKGGAWIVTIIVVAALCQLMQVGTGLSALVGFAAGAIVFGFLFWRYE